MTIVAAKYPNLRIIYVFSSRFHRREVRRKLELDFTVRTQHSLFK